MSTAVSVIVPVHNTAPWLARCIDSLLAQSLRDMEIILVDDASTDASPSIAAAYRDAHPGKVRFVRLAARQGLSGARNAGMPLAQGEFVGFVDSDDYVAPDMFACLYSRARSEGAQLAVCGMREVYSDSTTRDFVPRPMDALALLKDRRFQASVCSKIFLRSRLEKNNIRFPQDAFAEDMAFTAKFLFTEPKVAVVEKALYFYVKRGSSLSFSLANRGRVFIALRDIRQYMERAGIQAKFTGVYVKHFFLQAVYYPACLFFIDSIIKGHNRRENLRALPGYLAALARFLLRRDA